MKTKPEKLLVVNRFKRHREEIGQHLVKSHICITQVRRLRIRRLLQPQGKLAPVDTKKLQVPSKEMNVGTEAAVRVCSSARALARGCLLKCPVGDEPINTVQCRSAAITNGTSRDVGRGTRTGRLRRSLRGGVELNGWGHAGRPAPPPAFQNSETVPPAWVWVGGRRQQRYLCWILPGPRPLGGPPRAQARRGASRAGGATQDRAGRLRTGRGGQGAGPVAIASEVQP